MGNRIVTFLHVYTPTQQLYSAKNKETQPRGANGSVNAKCKNKDHSVGVMTNINTNLTGTHAIDMLMIICRLFANEIVAG